MARFGRRYPIRPTVTKAVAQAAVDGNADVASSSVAVYAPTIQIVTGAVGTTTATVTGNSPVGRVSPSAGTVSASVQGFDVESTPRTDAAASLALVDVDALDTRGGVGPVASTAAGSVAVYGPTPSAVPQTATTTGTAYGPSVSITFGSGTASVSLTYPQTDTDNTFRTDAGHGSVTSTVYGPTRFDVSFVAGVAPVAGTAYDVPNQQVGVLPGVNTGAVTAYSPTAKVGPIAPVVIGDADVLTGIFSPLPALVDATAYNANVYVDSPDWRTLDVPPDSRTKVIPAEDRTMVMHWRLDDVRVR